MMNLPLLVLTQYIASGGKSTTHGWVKNATNLGLVSYVAAQLYEHSSGNRFRAIINKHARARTFAFAHLAVDCILHQLPGSAELSPDKKTLSVDAAGMDAFLRYNQPQTRPRVLDAVKELIKARRQAAKRSGNEGHSNEEEGILPLYAFLVVKTEGVESTCYSNSYILHKCRRAREIFIVPHSHFGSNPSKLGTKGKR